MNADEARCVGEMTGVRVRKYKGIEHFDPRLFLEAPQCSYELKYKAAW